MAEWISAHALGIYLRGRLSSKQLAGRHVMTETR